MYTVDREAVELSPLSEDEITAHVESYTRSKIPWDHLNKYYRYRRALECKPIVKTTLSEAESPHDLPEVDDAVDSFFKSDCRPRWLPRTGQFVDYWIFWAITQGRFRADHNKKLKVFRYCRPPHITELRWAQLLKDSEAADWVQVPDNDSYDIFLQITDACNNVLTGIRRRLRDTEITTNSGRVCFYNLNRHPEFVPFQNNRTRDHQKYFWKFQPKNKGGNQGYEEPAKPLCIPKQSVHFLMRELHEWLPSFRRRRRKKLQII